HRAAFADAGDLVHQPFDPLRMIVAAVDDQDVLDASGNEDPVADLVTEISGVQPTAPERGLRSFRVLPISGGQARSAEADPADVALGKDPAVVILHGDFVAHEGATAAPDFQEGAALGHRTRRGVGVLAFGLARLVTRA